MIDRISIKERSKQAASRNYWVNVAVLFVLGLLGAGFAKLSFKFDLPLEDFVNMSFASPAYYYKGAVNGYYGTRVAFSFIGIVIFVVIVAAVLLGSGFSIFVSSPLLCSRFKYFSDVYRGTDRNFAYPFEQAFKTNYLRKVGGMLWQNLFLLLWSLLFIVPGVIKSFSYAATPYILAVFPNVKAKDALKLSMKIMDGRKLDLFIFYLSFFGWELLNALTFGLLGIFWLNPYKATAVSGFFDEVVVDALKQQTITLCDLGEQEII